MHEHAYVSPLDEFIYVHIHTQRAHVWTHARNTYIHAHNHLWIRLYTCATTLTHTRTYNTHICTPCMNIYNMHGTRIYTHAYTRLHTHIYRLWLRPYVYTHIDLHIYIYQSLNKFAK